jgi:hypothetical protein
LHTLHVGGYSDNKLIRCDKSFLVRGIFFIFVKLISTLIKKLLSKNDNMKNRTQKFFLVTYENSLESYVKDIFEVEDPHNPYSIRTTEDLRAIKLRLPFLGGGILELRPSTYLQRLGLPPTELGVFTKKEFKRGEVISYYDGWIVYYAQRKYLKPEEISHAKALFLNRIMIIGNHKSNGTLIKDPLNETLGFGAASYVNHGGDEKHRNAHFVDFTTEDLKDRQRVSFNPDYREKLILLVATRNIKSNTEILVDYGVSYDFSVAN